MKSRNIMLIVLAVAVAFMFAACDLNSIGKGMNSLKRNVFFPPEVSTEVAAAVNNVPEDLKETDENTNKTKIKLTGTSVGDAAQAPQSSTDKPGKAFGDLATSNNPEDFENFVKGLFTTETAYKEQSDYKYVESLRDELKSGLNDAEEKFMRDELSSMTVVVDENVKEAMILTADNVGSLKTMVDTFVDKAVGSNPTSSVTQTLTKAKEVVGGYLTNVGEVLGKFEEKNSFDTSKNETTMAAVIVSTSLNALANDCVSIITDQEYQAPSGEDAVKQAYDTFKSVVEEAAGTLTTLDILTDSDVFSSIYRELGSLIKVGGAK